MQPLTLVDKLLSNNVQRWHTVPMSKNQPVSCHSHGVGILAEEILKRVVKEPTIEDKYLVLKYAQLHDLSEIFTGDLPYKSGTYMKEQVRDFGKELAKMEDKLNPEFAEVLSNIHERPFLKYVVKSADLLEGYFFFLMHKGQAEQFNKTVIDSYVIAIDKQISEAQTNYSELNWQGINEIFSELREGKCSITTNATLSAY